MFYDFLYDAMMVYVAKSWPSKNQSELYIYPKTTLPYNNINYQQTHTWMHAASCRTKPVLIKKKIDRKHSVDMIIDWSYVD